MHSLKVFLRVFSGSSAIFLMQRSSPLMMGLDLAFTTTTILSLGQIPFSVVQQTEGFFFNFFFFKRNFALKLSK